MNLYKTYKTAGLVLSSLFLSYGAAAQNDLWQGKEANNWAFGSYAGLNFDTGNPLPLAGVNFHTLEGSVAMSSPTGELLFYAAENNIYNRDNEKMQNGDGVHGFNTSASQAGVIVPKPGSPNIYYAFALASLYETNGLTYNEIDMSLAQGKGAVVNRDVVVNANTMAEKITAVHHANGRDVWVIAHEMGNNNYVAYLVTENGVGPAVTSSVGLVYDLFADYDYGAGQMKVSPDGKHLAAAIIGVNFGFDKGTEITSFNNETGEVSNPHFIEATQGILYGLEFSPDGRFLYTCESTFAWVVFIDGKLKQYDMLAGDGPAIEASVTLVGDLSGTQYVVNSFQVGPDGRIYITNFMSSNTLHVINNPNNKGFAAGFQPSAISIGDGANVVGITNFVQTYFKSGIRHEGECSGAPVTFTTVRIPDIESITWNFGDPESGEANISNQPVHRFSRGGTFTVTAEITSNGGIQTVAIEVEIIQSPEPVAPPAEERTLCANAEGNATFNLEAMIPTILDGAVAADHTVTFYATQADLEAGNAITGITEFTTTGQTIYVTVASTVTGCETTIDFGLIVNPLPALGAAQVTEACAKNLQGTGVFNLTLQQNNILNGGDPTLFTVAYYADEARTALIATPDNFTSAGQTIYVRVTNIATGCFSDTAMTVAVSAPDGLPEGITIEDCTVFDLTLAGLEMAGYTNVSYYENEDQALAGNAIANPAGYVRSTNSGTVYVVGYDADGCISTGEITLAPAGCVLPKGISPNNDTYNDTFDLSSFAVTGLSIFNRYGMEVFTYGAYTDQWHGQDSKGNELPTGTYFYMIQIADGEQLTGWVYLNREIN